MRKLCLLALTVGMFACGGADATTPPPQPPAPPPPPAPVATADTTPAPAATADATPAPSLGDKEQAAIKGLMDAVVAHDAKKYASFYTSDGLVKRAGSPDLTGQDAITAEVQKAFDAFPDLKVAATRIFLKDDTAILEWTQTGTNTGTGLMGGKSTGKPVGFNALGVLKFTPDGLVKEEHDYYDIPTILGQLGISKEKARPVATLPTAAVEVHVAKGTPEEDKNVATSKAVQKMFETHDDKGFADVTADNLTWDDMTTPAPVNGKAAAVSNFKMMAKAFPDMKMQCDTWGVEDYLIEECATTGTNKGAIVAPGMKLPATNKTINLHGVDVMQIKDGKAVKGTSYGNGMEMMTQLGLIKPEKPKADAAKKDTAKKDAAKPAATKPATK